MVRTDSDLEITTARLDLSPLRIRMRFLSVFITSVIVVGAEHSTGCSRQSDCDRSEKAVTAPLRKIVESDNAKNIEGVLGCYSDDVIFLPPSGDVVKGKTAIRARYERLFTDFKPELTSETTEVNTSGEVAYVRGYTRGTLSPSTGGAPTKLEDKFLAVLRCHDGAWQVTRLMWSPVNQAP